MKTRLLLPIILAIIAGPASSMDIEEFLGFEPVDARENPQAAPKTLFQTSRPYNPLIDIPVDGVIIHRHGLPMESTAQAMHSWSDHQYEPQRMFFADSDAEWVYTRGGFDGEEHPEAIEQDSAGNQILCAGVRPYMVPTQGWIKYLGQITEESVQHGARAIYPEEPLAHSFSGYEECTKQLFQERYGRKWTPPHESVDAFYEVCRLKNELYLKLEQDLHDITEASAGKIDSDVRFLIPIHSLYSNLASRLVAPLGTSLSIDGHDGYIGQIWSGPVNWARANYSDKSTTPFDSAYLLYDFFVNLTLGTDKDLYLLTDPVEDDPNRTWEQYEGWYKDCLVAKLMFPSVDKYEIMPWPERIFMPGEKTGGGSPAPAHYRTKLMSAFAALQEIKSQPENELMRDVPRIGMLVGDTAMWQERPDNKLDAFFGLLVPVLRRGIPISSVPIERADDIAFMNRHEMLLLSYEAWKPEKAEYHDQLLRWVRNGGILIVFDTADSYNQLDHFWTKDGLQSPAHHLLAGAGFNVEEIANLSMQPVSKELGMGSLIALKVQPSQFAEAQKAQQDYLPLLMNTYEKYLGKKWNEPRYFRLDRRDYIAIHTFDREYTLSGQYIDLLDEDLSVLDDPAFPPHTSALLKKHHDSPTPSIEHATFRLMQKREHDNLTTFWIKGPAETDGRVRIHSAGKTLDNSMARTLPSGEETDFTIKPDGDDSYLISFPYHPEGIAFRLEWK